MTEARAGSVLDDRFRLVGQVGGGGAASVWRAKDLESGRVVAVKLLHPKYRAHAAIRERLFEEARLLSHFDHPNLARALSFALEHVQPYFVMELITGGSLQDELADRSSTDRHLSTGLLLHLLEGMAGAIDYAHAHGVVHRDLKPANIMLASEGTGKRPTVKVLDFGIAKLLERKDELMATTRGRVLGSGFYMSPEQALGKPISPRSDIFALGAVIFELITLRRAWVRSDTGGPILAFGEPARVNSFNQPSEVLQRMVRGARPRPSAFRPALSQSVDEVLMTAMAIEPSDRYPSGQAFLIALRDALPNAWGDSTAEDRPRPLAAGETAMNPALSSDGAGRVAIPVAITDANPDANPDPTQPTPGPWSNPEVPRSDTLASAPPEFDGMQTLDEPPQSDLRTGDLVHPQPMAAGNDGLSEVVTRAQSLGASPRPSSEEHEAPTRAVVHPAGGEATGPLDPTGQRMHPPPANSWPDPAETRVSPGGSGPAGPGGFDRGPGGFDPAGPGGFDRAGPGRFDPAGPGGSDRAGPGGFDPAGPGGSDLTASGGGPAATPSGVSSPIVMPGTPVGPGPRRRGWTIVGGLTVAVIAFSAGRLWDAFVAPPPVTIVPAQMSPTPQPAAEERPGATSVAEPAPAPEPETEAAPPKPRSAAAPARRATPAPPPPPAPRPTAGLRRTLKQVRADPSDLEALGRLSTAIQKKAGAVPDQAKQARIRRLAASNAMVGDVEGVARALDLLEASLPTPP